MKYGLGWVRQKLDHRDVIYSASPVDIRKNVDLRPDMPPVYDQGQTGSCVANATAAAFQYSRMAQSLPNWVPSRLFIYWNARSYEGTTNSDAGSECRDGVKVVAKLGVCPENNWSYDESMVTVRPNDESFTIASHAKAIQYAAVKQSLEHILSCLRHGLPIIFGTNVFQSFVSGDTSQTGIVHMPEPTEASVGGHAILIVGWKPDTQEFIVRNSWGNSWGNDGYCYFPRDYILDPNLSSDFWVIYLTSRN